MFAPFKQSVMTRSATCLLVLKLGLAPLWAGGGDPLQYFNDEIATLKQTLSTQAVVSAGTTEETQGSASTTHDDMDEVLEGAHASVGIAEATKAPEDIPLAEEAYAHLNKAIAIHTLFGKELFSGAQCIHTLCRSPIDAAHFPFLLQQARIIHERLMAEAHLLSIVRSQTQDTRIVERLAQIKDAETAFKELNWYLNYAASVGDPGELHHKWKASVCRGVINDFASMYLGMPRSQYHAEEESIVHDVNKRVALWAGLLNNTLRVANQKITTPVQDTPFLHGDKRLRAPWDLAPEGNVAVVYNAQHQDEIDALSPHVHGWEKNMKMLSYAIHHAYEVASHPSKPCEWNVMLCLNEAMLLTLQGFFKGVDKLIAHYTPDSTCSYAPVIDWLSALEHANKQLEKKQAGKRVVFMDAVNTPWSVRDVHEATIVLANCFNLHWQDADTARVLEAITDIKDGLLPLLEKEGRVDHDATRSKR